MTKAGANNRKLFEREFKPVLEEARRGEQRCLTGKRWHGNPLLIVVDASLDSIGLNYFQIVIPRVKRFHEEYVKTGQITSFEDLSKLKPWDPRLVEIMSNQRCWTAAINICKELHELRKRENLPGDFEALHHWAQSGNYESWRDDPIGRIYGVGLITFQYLRMQAGINTAMPDKIIKRVMGREFGIEAKDDVEFIKKMKQFSRQIGYSQLLICWAIWLKEADKRFDIGDVE